MKTDAINKRSDCQKVNVSEDVRAVVVCPHCETRYRVNTAMVKTRGRRSKVTCKCGQSFLVFFEFRENPRRVHEVSGFYRAVREISVRGHYRTVPISERFEKMEVRNISRSGIGFVVPGGHDLQVEDMVELIFRLDDEVKSRIERTAIVRRVAEGNYLGCEFTEIGYVDAATGFYVMT